MRKGLTLFASLLIGTCSVVAAETVVLGGDGAAAAVPSVVSDKAIFGFDEETRRMKLLAICPWATLDDVLANMDFEPLVAEPLGTVAPPTEEQLSVLRARVDPTGLVIDQGKWITYTPES